MLNNAVLVGRLVRDPEVYETENGKKVTTVTLAVPRSFKNMNGEYETDFIPCILWQGVAENTKEYCMKGDLIGVKGRLQTKKIEGDGFPNNIIEFIGERVTFLSSKNPETEE